MNVLECDYCMLLCKLAVVFVPLFSIGSEHFFCIGVMLVLILPKLTEFVVGFCDLDSVTVTLGLVPPMAILKMTTLFRDLSM